MNHDRKPTRRSVLKSTLLAVAAPAVAMGLVPPAARKRAIAAGAGGPTLGATASRCSAT